MLIGYWGCAAGGGREKEQRRRGRRGGEGGEGKGEVRRHCSFKYQKFLGASKLHWEFIDKDCVGKETAGDSVRPNIHWINIQDQNGMLGMPKHEFEVVSRVLTIGYLQLLGRGEITTCPLLKRPGKADAVSCGRGWPLPLLLRWYQVGSQDISKSSSAEMSLDP